MKRFLSYSVVGACIFLSAYALMPDRPHGQFTAHTTVSDALLLLGDDPAIHHTTDRTDVVSGFELFTTGVTSADMGDDSPGRISKHFVCTDCHNLVKEDPDLTVSDPEARLAYAAEMNLPFLQGTTMFGVVNRSTWYNDDYLNKYGAMIAPARDTLVNAIQLCATQCSQGREMTDWEISAMIQYFHTIQITLGDLGLNQDQYNRLDQAWHQGGVRTEEIEWLKSRYLSGSPATFIDPKDKSARTYGEGGNAENGKLIYDLSCMHCHSETGVTNFILNDETLTFAYLDKHMKDKGNKSIYVISRKGTYSVGGYKPYMPHYTAERMSLAQMEDLAAYIKQRAGE